MILTDRFQRRIVYLRLSVTDRCNYRCTYCLPEEGMGQVEREDILRFEEVVALVESFVALGVRCVRVTGGEPLVRRGLPQLIARLRALEGLEELSMTTNGHLLPEMAHQLKRAGLDRLNISLDTLDPEKFHHLTRGGDLGRVMEGIEVARRAGFQQIKINTVALKDINDDELHRMVEFAWGHDLIPRLLELMPFGPGKEMFPARRMNACDILNILKGLVDPAAPCPSPPGLGPATYYPSRRYPGRVLGIIAAGSPNFCTSCNRFRLTADGRLQPCLADIRGVSLRDPLRRGASAAELQEIIRHTLALKDEGHRLSDPARHRDHRGLTLAEVGG